MIKILLIAALAISAHTLGTPAACTGTYTQCSMCTSAAPTSSGSQEVCATCNSGFSLPASVLCTGTACTAGISNCASCAAATPTVCSACNAGYALDSTNNVCVSCTTGATGYTGANAAFATCSVSSAKAITGLTCNTGYVRDTTNSVCVNCASAAASSGSNTYTGGIANCNTCTLSSSALTCTACAAGYIWDSGNSACAGCATGKGTTTGSTAVTYTGPIANCGTCTVSSGALTCTACGTGYVWDSTGSACAGCATGKGTTTGGTSTTYTGAIANCGVCTISSSALTCSTCASGYIWDSTNSACAGCATGKGATTGGTATTYTGSDANCAKCTISSAALSCTGCNTGYFLYFNGTCGTGTGADANCQYYANSVHCIQCASGSGYTVLSNTCVACPSNCNLCDVTGKICSVCGSGYKLSTSATGTCVPNGANIIMPGFALLSIIFYYLF